jgi:hypothetical protein
MFKRPVTCLIVGTAVVCGAFLISATAVQGAIGRATNAARTVQDASLAQEIQQVRALLAQANHDYEGHRVKAMEHLHKSIHHLHKDTNSKFKSGKVTEGVGGENQAVSDAQLKKAVNTLKVIQGQLNSLPTTPHRTSANEHLTEAISHLNTALTIR